MCRDKEASKLSSDELVIHSRMWEDRFIQRHRGGIQHIVLRDMQIVKYFCITEEGSRWYTAQGSLGYAEDLEL